MKEIKILVLTGSKRDLVDGDEPTSFVKRLLRGSDEIKQNYAIECTFRFKACSADRTPFLLNEVLNQDPFDAIIYSGGYSLVLGAGLQEALLRNRYHEELSYYSTEFQSFLDQGLLGQEYLPGSFDRSLITREPSWLYGKHDWIPAICVPGADSISEGLSSFISVTENPSGSEPRPVVGLGCSDSALRVIHAISNHPKSFNIVCDGHCDQSLNAAQTLKSEMNSLGLDGELFSITNDQSIDFLGRESFISIFVGTPKAVELLRAVDRQSNLTLFCPVKSSMKATWYQHLEQLDGLEKTICVGVGAYENTAMLLCRILGTRTNLEAMWKRRNAKTIASVMEPIGDLERSLP